MIKTTSATGITFSFTAIFAQLQKRTVRSNRVYQVQNFNYQHQKIKFRYRPPLSHKKAVKTSRVFCVKIYTRNLLFANIRLRNKKMSFRTGDYATLTELQVSIRTLVTPRS